MADANYNRNVLIDAHRDAIIEAGNSDVFDENGTAQLSDLLNHIAAQTDYAIPPVSGFPSGEEYAGIDSRGRSMNQRMNDALRAYDYDEGSKNSARYYCGIYKSRQPGTPEAEQVAELTEDSVGAYQSNNRTWRVTREWWVNGSPEMPDDEQGTVQMPGGIWLYRQGLPKGTRRGRPSGPKKELAPIKTYSVDVPKVMDDLVEYFRDHPESYADLQARMTAAESTESSEATEPAEATEQPKRRRGKSKSKAS